jgi:hypothetical protein
MSDELRSILTGTLGLIVAGVAALVLTYARGGVLADTRVLRSTVRIVFLAIACQAAHFVEEAATDFPDRFPQLLGLTPWPLRFFVWLNLAWLLLWAVAGWGLVARVRIALFPLWFLGIASVANAVAHPAFALRTGGYFPGLFTSPLVGFAGILLLVQLTAVTRSRHPA